MDEKLKEQLNAPAFTSQEVKETVPAEVSQTKGEEKETASSGAEKPVVEQEVPYSRFSSVSKRLREAEKLAEEATAKYEALVNKQAPQEEGYDFTSEPPKEFFDIYGDNEVSRKIWRSQQSVEERMIEAAEKRAEEAAERRLRMEETSLNQNEKEIDSEFEVLQDTLGRELNEDEYSAVLDIADKYSPTGEDGKYLSGKPLPLDQAWEIFQLQQAQAGSNSKQSRSQATLATGTRSQGQSQPTLQEKNKDFDPLNWSFLEKLKGK